MDINKIVEENELLKQTVNMLKEMVEKYEYELEVRKEIRQLNEAESFVQLGYNSNYLLDIITITIPETHILIANKTNIRKRCVELINKLENYRKQQ